MYFINQVISINFQYIKKINKRILFMLMIQLLELEICMVNFTILLKFCKLEENLKKINTYFLEIMLIEEIFLFK